MISFRTWAIIKREIKQQIFSRRFIFTTLALPVFMFIVVSLQFLFQGLAEEDNLELILYSEAEALLPLLQEAVADDDNIAGIRISMEAGDAYAVAEFIESNRRNILSGDIDGVIFIPAAAMQDKRVSFYSNNAGNQTLLNAVRNIINNALLDSYMEPRDLDSSVVDFVRRNVLIDSARVTATGTEGGSAQGQQLVAMFFTFLLYVSLLMISAPAMGAVNEEKVSRVVEVVLSSVNASELMAGKVIGSAAAGFLQILIWLLAILFLLSGSVPLLLALSEVDMQINFSMLLYFMLNYLIGVLIFLSIFSAFGAMFDNPQDAQSSMFPVMLLVIIPFILAFTVVGNPSSSLGLVSSMLPFAAILVMPARMVLIDVPLWQFAVAIAVNLLTLFMVILLCGKIYRFTILMTGKRPSWREIYKWIRYA